MKKYIVTDTIEYKNKYLLKGDRLLLVREFNGNSSSSGFCTPATKEFCHLETREKIILLPNDFDKISIDLDE